jgi:hypothetical protein
MATQIDSLEDGFAEMEIPFGWPNWTPANPNRASMGEIGGKRTIAVLGGAPVLSDATSISIPRRNEAALGGWAVVRR